MPRTARKAPAGILFHVLNRGVGRRGIFEKEEDYAAFERVMAHALEAVPVHLLSYCLMPNHWHLLVCPQEQGQLARFMQRLTMTHTRRWQEHYDQVGVGHLYQGRFKSFPVQEDRHFLIVARYIERNALRANLVARAQDWRWSSLWRRVGQGGDAGRVPLPLAVWPVPQPMDWLSWVNEPQTQTEVDALRHAVAKGRPFGDGPWQRTMIERLGLHSSHRPTGHPRRGSQAGVN
jgi:putative transposase